MSDHAVAPGRRTCPTLSRAESRGYWRSATGSIINQLQLIGAMVLGFAVLTVLGASDPQRYRAVIAVTMFVGMIAISIFVGNVALGRVPTAFLVNAALLALQIVPIEFVYPWRDMQTRSLA